MEMAWATNDEIMVHGEGVVRHIAKTMLDECEQELTSIERDLDLLARYADSAYPRMRYDEAIETLQGMGIEVAWGDDLDYSKEKVLTQDFDVPHFLTHYPKVAKPFYHRVDPRTRTMFSATTSWRQKATVKSLVEESGHGRKRKSFVELTRRAHLVSRINSTLTSVRMAVFHTVALDSALTGWLVGSQRVRTSARSSPSHEHLAASHPDQSRFHRTEGTAFRE